MLSFVKKIGKTSLVIAGIAVIIVAIALGAFRFLASQLPGYQDDIQEWFAAELGLNVQFDTVDLRMGFLGPEVSLLNAAIAGSTVREPFIFASEATVTLNPFALIADRENAARRLSFEGIRLTVVRSPDGSIRILDAPQYVLPEANFEFQIPPNVELRVRNSSVEFLDRVIGVEWAFEDISIDVVQERNAISLSVRATPPPELGRQFEFAVEGSLEQAVSLSDDWNAFVAFRGTDLAAIADFVPASLQVESGSGDVSVWFDVTAGTLDRLMADVSLEQIELSREGREGPDGASDDTYERIALTAEWSRLESGWQLAFDEVDIRRNGGRWPRGGHSLLRLDERFETVVVESDFFRLEDLAPLIVRVPVGEVERLWRTHRPTGEIEDLSIELDLVEPRSSFEVSGRFHDLGFAAVHPWPDAAGLSGEIRADERSGILELDSEALRLVWPALFERRVDVGSLNGTLVWRDGRNGLRIVTDELAFEFLGADVRSSLELTIPASGQAPRIDLVSRVGAFDLLEAKPYVTDIDMPESVTSWLDKAVNGGRVEQLDLTLFGPLDALPFDAGEGQLHVIAAVTDGRLDYVEEWPAAEELDGEIEVTNARFVGRGSGRVLGNEARDVEVVFPDLRVPLMLLKANSAGPLDELLAFLNQAPQIADSLGPSFARLSALGGTSDLSIDLTVPLAELDQFELDADLEVIDGELAVAGFPPRATDVNGSLRLRDGVVTGERISASFFEGPVVARVDAPQREGYRVQLDVEGEATAESIFGAFNLPNSERFAGQTRWHGSLLIPTHNREPAEPVLVSASSNLAGIALKFPVPFEKAPAALTNLNVEFEFDDDGSLGVTGNLGASRRFIADYRHDGARYWFERGGLALGGDSPSMPGSTGLLITGSVPYLDVSEWSQLTSEVDTSAVSAAKALAGIDIEIASLKALGQDLGDSHVILVGQSDGFVLDIDSEPIEGRIVVPANLEDRPIVSATLERFHYRPQDVESGNSIDPRQLPGFSIEIEDFVLGQRQFGRVTADIEPEPTGLRLVSFESDTDDYSGSAEGTWLEGFGGPQTRLAFSFHASNVANALEGLGFDRLLDGEAAELTANLHWPGPPDADWMDHLGGELALRVNDGAILDIEPGAGRLVGLMSIVALPRRLSLDFRDVFNKGFAFDEISGDFIILDGNAFTDNLKLSGPVAEIGVVGRTGLRDRDLEQQAVVTAEPSNVLPTVGGLLGGAGVGAALLIFTRIFKEPLKGIGRAAYCITGGWDTPDVERLSQEQLDEQRLCAALPPAAVLSIEGDLP